jgi:hypothetical protein
MALTPNRNKFNHKNRSVEAVVRILRTRGEPFVHCADRAGTQRDGQGEYLLLITFLIAVVVAAIAVVVATISSLYALREGSTQWAKFATFRVALTSPTLPHLSRYSPTYSSHHHHTTTITITIIPTGTRRSRSFPL